MKGDAALSPGGLLGACACKPRAAPPLGKHSCNPRRLAFWPEPRPLCPQQPMSKCEKASRWELCHCHRPKECRLAIPKLALPAKPGRQVWVLAPARGKSSRAEKLGRKKDQLLA
eukprot:668502-Amphidinium_carterae.1